jgi:hypothetical protein
MFVSVTTTILFVVSSEPCRHWFVIPIMVCGFLIGIDFVDWLRGRMDLFDPVGILGFLGFHTLFLAPLLHVSMDYWMSFITPPPDWREWLGKMGALNAGGLSVYAVVSRVWKAPARPRLPRIWVRNPGFVLAAALVLTAAIQTSGGCLDPVYTSLPTPDPFASVLSASSPSDPHGRMPHQST